MRHAVRLVGWAKMATEGTLETTDGYYEPISPIAQGALTGNRPVRFLDGDLVPLIKLLASG